MVAINLATVAGFLMLLPNALALPAPSALALPGLNATILTAKRTDTGMPFQCDPDTPVDDSQLMAYADQSQTCQEQGVGDYCCATAVAGGFCAPDFGSASISDLENALAQQITKGWLSSTRVGQWDVSYGLIVHSKPPPAVLLEWFHGINVLADSLVEGATVSQLYFYYSGGGKKTQLYVDWICPY